MDKLSDTLDGVYYPHPTYGELTALQVEFVKLLGGNIDCSDEIIPICPTGHELMFDTLSDLYYTPVNTKHVKPFYHKGRW